MAIKHTQRLDVYRTLEKGNRVPVGTLAQNSKGVFFQYQPDYRTRSLGLCGSQWNGSPQLRTYI